MLRRTPNAMKSWNQLAKVYPISDVLHYRLGVVTNGQDFPHFDQWMQVKKLVQERIHVANST